MPYPRHRTGTKDHEYGERALWCKGVEAKMVKDCSLRVVMRPDDRSDVKKTPLQWLPLMEPLPVFFLVEGTGDPKDRSKPPEFEPDDGTTVRIYDRIVKPFKDVTEGDLHNGSGRAVVENPDELQKFFEEVQAPGKTFTPDSLITIYKIEYAD